MEETRTLTLSSAVNLRKAYRRKKKTYKRAVKAHRVLCRWLYDHGLGYNSSLGPKYIKAWKHYQKCMRRLMHKAKTTQPRIRVTDISHNVTPK